MRIFSLKICKDALFLNLKAQKNALLLASFKRFDERIQTHHERIILYAKIIQPIYWFKMLLAIIRFHTILCVLFQFNFINACFIFEVLQKALLSNLSRCSDKTFKLFLHLLLLHLAIYWNLQRKYAEICKKKKKDVISLSLISATLYILTSLKFNRIVLGSSPFPTPFLPTSVLLNRITVKYLMQLRQTSIKILFNLSSDEFSQAIRPNVFFPHSLNKGRFNVHFEWSIFH